MTMWRKAADSWYDKEGKVAEELAHRDEEMDELQTVLVSEVAASGSSFVGGHGAGPGGAVLRTPRRPCRQRGPHGVGPAR